MPQWAVVLGIILRFIDPNNNNEFAEKEKENFFMQLIYTLVELEHAVLHLLYADFGINFIYD
jgi:leucyl-tRNA synthetase